MLLDRMDMESVCLVLHISFNKAETLEVPLNHLQIQLLSLKEDIIEGYLSYLKVFTISLFALGLFNIHEGKYHTFLKLIIVIDECSILAMAQKMLLPVKPPQWVTLGKGS